MEGGEVTTLTKPQGDLLKHCEGIIEKGAKHFIEVGRALATIRDERLYKATHKSFERYCQERWDFGRSYACRLIQAADAEEVLPDGQQFESERQARAARDKEREQEAAPVEPEAEDPHDAEDDTEDTAAGTETGSVRELNRVGWWLDELSDSWKEYELNYGDHAEWMHFRIACEQFAAKMGHE